MAVDGGVCVCYPRRRMTTSNMVLCVEHSIFEKNIRNKLVCESVNSVGVSFFRRFSLFPPLTLVLLAFVSIIDALAFWNNSIRPGAFDFVLWENGQQANHGMLSQFICAWRRQQQQHRQRQKVKNSWNGIVCANHQRQAFYDFAFCLAFFVYIRQPKRERERMRTNWQVRCTVRIRCRMVTRERFIRPVVVRSLLIAHCSQKINISHSYSLLPMPSRHLSMRVCCVPKHSLIARCTVYAHMHFVGRNYRENEQVKDILEFYHNPRVNSCETYENRQVLADDGGGDSGDDDDDWFDFISFLSSFGTQFWTISFISSRKQKRMNSNRFEWISVNGETSGKEQKRNAKTKLIHSAHTNTRNSNRSLVCAYIFIRICRSQKWNRWSMTMSTGQNSYSGSPVRVVVLRMIFSFYFRACISLQLSSLVTYALSTIGSSCDFLSRWPCRPFATVSQSDCTSLSLFVCAPPV